MTLESFSKGNSPVGLAAEISRTIDTAVLQYYPEYAEAYNIVSLMQELVLGVVDYQSQITEVARVLAYGRMSRAAFKNDDVHEMRDYIIAEFVELVNLAYGISRTLASATPGAKKLVYSHFLNDAAEYNYCLDLLVSMERIATRWGE